MIALLSALAVLPLCAVEKPLPEGYRWKIVPHEDTGFSRPRADLAFDLDGDKFIDYMKLEE